MDCRCYMNNELAFVFVGHALAHSFLITESLIKVQIELDEVGNLSANK
jgi:hypothetical protein